MKPSIQKLRKFFRLEAEREYDNKAVMGGLSNILSAWEMEAREDQLSEQIIQAVISRLRDYHRLSEDSREVVLKGIWQRVTRETGVESETQKQPPVTKQPKSQPEQESGQPKKPEPAAAPEPEKSEPVPQAPAPKKDPPKVILDLDFQAPITTIKGIGEKKQKALERMGIQSINDLLYTFPRRHDDYSKLKPIGSLWYGEFVTVIGSVESVSSRAVRSGKMTIVEALISDKSGAIRATWFNQPWIENQLTKAKQVVLSGLVEQYLGRLVMNSPEWEPLSEKQLHTNRIVPVYPLTKDVTQKWLRGVIHDIVEEYSPHLPDPLPENIRVNHSLTDLPNAIREIHFPDSDQSLQKAKQRLAFEELFLMQMGVLSQKKQWESRSGTTFESSEDWLLLQLESLPFKLTNAQKKALDQVRADLSSGTPMNRLLQGDVGSGKTVVAALAALIVIHGGTQAAFLAPTSILAEQHFQSLKKLLTQGSGDLAENQIALLIGATPENEKADIRKQLADGEIKLIIGTHALLQDPV
ncbi:MAG: hypothetical protein DRI65_18615, partial [Chloroflexota bacterium]